MSNKLIEQLKRNIFPTGRVYSIHAGPITTTTQLMNHLNAAKLTEYQLRVELGTALYLTETERYNLEDSEIVKHMTRAIVDLVYGETKAIAISMLPDIYELRRTDFKASEELLEKIQKLLSSFEI